MIRILVYEDNKDMRDGICGLLMLSEGFQVLGAFSNCDNIQQQLQEFRPDILLMDIDMPGTNGIAGIRLAKAKDPAVNILMFTVFDDEEKIFAAIKAGAGGYLLKRTAPEKIIEALKDVYQGGAPMTPVIAKKVLGYFSEQPAKTLDEQLTQREKEVLRLLTNGLSHKMIAAELRVSIDTVHSHLKKIYSKLHVNSMTQAVTKAIRERLV